jgi:hypothetical protein
MNRWCIEEVSSCFYIVCDLFVSECKGYAWCMYDGIDVFMAATNMLKAKVEKAHA